MGKLYLNAAVDTFSSYAFGVVSASKQPRWAVAVLSDKAVPFYAQHGLAVGAILTDNGRAFCGWPHHSYQMLLSLSGIEHRRGAVGFEQTNGFMERFRQTVLNEFFRVKVKEATYESMEALQGGFDEWLAYYNEKRPHLSYPNMDKCPMDRVRAFAAGRLAS